ncbi:hypothetical protein C0Q70_09547 [Pomacea canaliculata]|uniref:Uncharacterized protein n=1 Tax=Pomacea canaliculata TaxID=400727 RepID=A0A2T7PA42_POMCA|nr:hypothetical protein C0Q70_09547 [Pomacea canaliculata]
MNKAEKRRKNEPFIVTCDEVFKPMLSTGSGRERESTVYSVQVNKYDLMVLEHGATGLTEERMVLAFQVLDELIPQLGLYSRIFTKLREDLFKAVYSGELTGVVEEGTDNKSVCGESYIQRLPYFVLVKRTHDKQNEQIEELKEQLDIVKKRLFDKHKQFEESQEKTAKLQEQIDHLNKVENELQQIISEKDAEICRIGQEMEKNWNNAENMQHQLECDIADLKDSLIEAKQEIEYLSQFKKGYDDMYYAFTDKDQESDEDNSAKKNPQTIIASKREYLIGDVHSANHMEEQILSVMNTAMEEFDKFLESHKQALEEKVITADMTDAEMDLQEMELDDADQELEVVQLRFESTIRAMLSELDLLHKHNNMMMEQLQMLEETNPSLAKNKNVEHVKFSSGKNNESILWAGLDEDDGKHNTADPYIPQDRVFSKYAAMLYTSNNSGKTFEEFKDAKYCSSCGEKTVICPHKAGGTEKVFVLPHNCTHLKISRPKVRVNRELVQMLVKPPSPELTLNVEPVLSSAVQSYQPAHNMSLTPDTVTSQESPSYSMGEAYMVNSFQRVWDDYHIRTDLSRTIPRPLTQEQTVSLFEEFLAYIILQDETAGEKLCFSILDNLYNFMKWRYLLDDIMYMMTHDFLSSIIKYSGADKMIELLDHVLVGNLDASCLRYVMLIADFIKMVDWMEVEDFRAFASLVYPFLTEDDLETLQMSYISFSENHISKQLVCSFIIHIILKYREPRFHDLENKLLPFQISESGHLTDKEHKDAMDSIVPLCNEHMRRRLFLEAEKAVAHDSISNAVPVMRLAQITGYLALQQITAVIKENLNTNIAEWRKRPSSTGSARQTADVTHQTAGAMGDDKLITLDKIKTLASNMARAAKHRKERQAQSRDEINR